MNNNNLPINNLKQHMDALFIFSSKVPYCEDHLLPIIQASKSLIGINLDHPPRNLLKWLDNYVKDFTPNFNSPTPNEQNLFPETITYTHLGELILNKRKSDSILYLTHLLQVANPLHIAEFLMELGVQISPGSFLFCWAAFRSIQFIGEKNGHSILYHSLSKLLEFDQCKQDSEILFREKFALYCHQFQICSTEMVRKNRIIPYLNKMINTIELELNRPVIPIIPFPLENIIRQKNEQEILTYISTLNIKDLSTDLILMLDAIRSAIKFSNNPTDLVLLSIFDNHIEKEYVE